MGAFSGAADWWTKKTERGILHIATKGLKRQSAMALNIDAFSTISYPGSGTLWKDLSGGGNDVTLVNGPTFINSTTKHFSFDGSNDKGWVKNLNYGSGTTIQEMSVFAWIRTTYNSGTAGVWNNTNWSLLDFDRSEVFTFTVNGTGEIQMSGRASNSGGFGSYFDIIGNTRYNDGNWHYIGWTYSVADQKIVMYGDGKVDRTFSANGSMTALGSGTRRYGIVGDGSEASSENGSSNSIYYQGDISAIHFYDNRALTANEIKKNFNATRKRFGL